MTSNNEKDIEYIAKINRITNLMIVVPACLIAVLTLVFIDWNITYPPYLIMIGCFLLMLNAHLRHMKEDDSRNEN